jgi:hypothetical protein
MFFHKIFSLSIICLNDAMETKALTAM